MLTRFIVYTPTKCQIGSYCMFISSRFFFIFFFYFCLFPQVHRFTFNTCGWRTFCFIFSPSPLQCMLDSFTTNTKPSSSSFSRRHSIHDRSYKRDPQTSTLTLCYSNLFRALSLSVNSRFLCNVHSPSNAENFRQHINLFPRFSCFFFFIWRISSGVNSVSTLKTCSQTVARRDKWTRTTNWNSCNFHNDILWKFYWHFGWMFSSILHLLKISPFR